MGAVEDGPGRAGGPKPPSDGAGERASTPSAERAAPAGWTAAVDEVHADIGGDRALLEAAAERIAEARRATDRAVRGAGIDGRLAAVTLTPLPVLLAVLLVLVEPAAADRAGPLAWVALAVAAALTGAGGWWLWRVAQPPFSWRPGHWRAYADEVAREQRIVDAVDRASLAAVAGAAIAPAVRHAVPDAEHPAAALLPALEGLEDTGDPDLALGPRPPEWVAVVVHRRADGAPPPEALAAGRAWLQADRVRDAEARARRLPLTTVVPFAACILPALLLVLAALFAL